MNKSNPADGTYVFVKTDTVPPSTFTNFQDNTKGLTDEAIINSVRYVLPDSPETPANMLFMFEGGAVLNRIPGMKCRIALWPDKVCAVLCYPENKRKPRKSQLVRTYRNARHTMRAVAFSELNAQGVSA